jgi:hypothetical protein
MRPLFLTSRSFLFFLLPFLLATGLSMPAFSQTSDHTTDRIVWLNNGDTIHSRRLQFKVSNTGDKFLLLDNGRELPIDRVSRFRERRGTFVVMSGSAGPDVYKIIKEGPRISAYSRTLYEAPLDTNGAHPVAYYYRKAGQQQMSLLTYTSLLNAMEDNQAAQQQVRLTKKQFIGGVAISLVSVAVVAVGFYKTYHRTANQPLPPSALPTTPPFNPYGPPPPPPSLPPLPKQSSLSPLVYLGIGGVGAGLVIGLGAHRHELRAFDLYNQGTP